MKNQVFVDAIEIRIREHLRISRMRGGEYKNTNDYHAEALTLVKEFALLGFIPRERDDGLWQLGKFIVSMKKRSFRVDGKWVWYKWSTPKSFISKYGDQICT